MRPSRTRRVIAGAWLLLSALLLAAVCAQCIRSYWVKDEYTIRWYYLRWHGDSSRGMFRMFFQVRGQPAMPSMRWKTERPTDLHTMLRWREPVTDSGVGWIRGWDRHIRSEAVVKLPQGLVATLAAIAPAVWLRRRLLVTLRHRRGRCVSCGYNLRGSPGDCPECGAVRRPAANG